MLERLLDILNDIREEKGEDRLDEITENTSLRRDIGFDSFDLALLSLLLFHLSEGITSICNSDNGMLLKSLEK